MTRVYIVEGRYPFPTDMLRYDESQVIPQHRKLVEQLSAEFAETQELLRGIHRVTLTTERSDFFLQYGSAKRWESFGWKIVSIAGVNMETLPPPPSPPTHDELLERVARALCKARGTDPDSRQHYDDGSNKAVSRYTVAWKLAAIELKGFKLLIEHVEMLR